MSELERLEKQLKDSAIECSEAWDAWDAAEAKWNTVWDELSIVKKELTND
jgi:hypothetical protein